MNCNRCNTPGKYVQFQTFSYWYCVGCKDEIFPAKEDAYGRKMGELLEEDVAVLAKKILECADYD